MTRWKGWACCQACFRCSISPTSCAWWIVRAAPAVGYPSSVLLTLAKGRMATLARADIAAAIHGALDRRVQTRFGDSIRAIDDAGSRVRLDFDQSPSQDFDLVIGADGLHSRVREIHFGPEAAYEHPMGCHVASFEVAGYRPRNGNAYVAHTAPGPVRGALPDA
jgi:2-polyprenyl-6-methoxyphenol hydroxylase-like FAD-dependent oxidoreductase